MEAITINVNVGLKEETLRQIEKLVRCLGGQSPTPATPAPQPEQAAPATQTEAPQAPSVQAPAVTTAMLREAVADAKQRKGSADPIRELFTKFGIENSSKCPEERRPELYNALKAL